MKPMKNTHAVESEETLDIPLQSASTDIWDTKYRLKAKNGDVIDDTVDATWQRVARALAEVEQPAQREHWYERFLWALRHGAIPAGRITSNAGARAHKPATSTINCTVSGTITDSMNDILAKVHEAGLTLKAGCVAPGTWVRTERGVVRAEEAVAERHARILSYDRERDEFEMRAILHHKTTRVPREQNIELVSGDVSLKTSIRHPVLVYRDEKLIYVRADDVRTTDALVHHRFPWRAEAKLAKAAWFAGAHLGDGSAYKKRFDYKPGRTAWAERARTLPQRLVFKIRAAEQEVVECYAAFFGAFCGSKARVVAAQTPGGTPVWDYTVASFGASRAAELIDHQCGRKTAALRVPAWISAHPERHFLPFLAGLLDTDGTVSREHGSASLATQNHAFADEIKSILGLFGVHADITHRQPRSHMLNGNEVRDSGGAMLKISDSDFLAVVAKYMVAPDKRRRIRECASQPGQYGRYCVPGPLRRALTENLAAASHKEKRTLGFYHGYHEHSTVSRMWLDRWADRFPELVPMIDFARSLRPLDSVRRALPLAETFYDFTVEKNNNYVAGDGGLVVIHNCGIGYEFSTLRPRGAYVAGAGAYTSGPLSFMDIYDKMCFTVSSAGGRRGAQMGTFDVGHPDVMEFIRAKREDGRLRQFNLSLLITEAFMEAVSEGGDWPLAFPLDKREAQAEDIDTDDSEKVLWREWPVHDQSYIVNDEGLVACRIYRRIKAQHLWNLIMTSTYDYAEPGFVLIDRVNDMNNNWFCENIRATNPCVTADTRLATQYGMVPIGELYERGLPLQATVDRRALETGDRGTEVRPAKPAFMTARAADVYRVRTAAGYEIKATEWHDFYTHRGKIKLRDLKPGDELFVQSGKGQFGTEGSENLGILLGFITGDGHFTNRGKGAEAVRVDFWNEERALADRVAGYVNTLSADVLKRTRTYKVAPVAVSERNHVFIRSVLLARVLEHCGFTRQSKLAVPEVIWRGSEACVKGYLQALFQATVQREDKKAYRTIRLASSAPDFLKDVQRLLANFGIFSRILQRRNAGTRELPDGKGGTRTCQCKADHELIIDGESYDVFMREIGFLLDNKNGEYREWAADRSRGAYKKPFASRITEIVHIGREAVFDTTQPDHNAVIFNGLVTGQCGEQPLPPFGSCLLGSVNLTRFVHEPFTDKACFDWDTYREVVGVFTRMLDNVVEVNGLPLAGQREEIMRKRRHGMGFLGLGSTLTMMGMKYGCPESLEFTEAVAREMALAGWREALELAGEKGPAPIMEEDFEITSELLRKRPQLAEDGYKVGDTVKGKTLWARYSHYMRQVIEVAPELGDQLAERGARFTHHTSIAPTGTISLSLANNASNGIEPSFAHHYFRNVIREGRKSKEKVDVFSFELLAYRHLVDGEAMANAGAAEHALPDCFITAEDISPTEHVDIQAAAQKWVDSSISKTANVPTKYPFEDFKDIYVYAWKQGLKGCTTFRFNPEAFQGVLVKESDLKNTTYRFKLADGTTVEAKGDEEIEYDGETHTAANLFDALKEGYYGKF